MIGKKPNIYNKEPKIQFPFYNDDDDMMRETEKKLARLIYPIK